MHILCFNFYDLWKKHACMQVYNEEIKEHDHAVDALRYAVMGKRGAKATVAYIQW